MSQHETELLSGQMALVAEELLGAPNARLSKNGEQRYGTNGSLSVDVETGRFYDHEAKTGGGVLDLIARQTGRDLRGAADWMREHGLIEQDRPQQPRSEKAKRSGNGAAAPLGPEVAHYDYVNEADEFLFQVVRFEPKTFRQRRRPRPDDDPEKIKYGWVYTSRDVRHVLYRLPQVIEAVATDKTIYVVEGEKDVDNLWNIGLPATCNAGGTGKWSAELSEFLRGANVVILPDHDPQAKTPDGALRFHDDGSPVYPGQDHAMDVARQLHGVAAHVRVLNLSLHWPEMPSKGDVSDWIAQGGTAEALQPLVERTREWSPAPFKSRFGGQRWEDIGQYGLSTGYTWAVEDIVPMAEISLIFGDSGTGKSFDAFDMGMCIARGLPFNGHNVEQGLVIYIAAEAGKGFGKRKRAYITQHGLSDDVSFPFYLMTKRPDFFTSDADIDAIMVEIKEIAAAYSVPLVCIVLDTLSALAPGMNENASQDVSLVRARLVRLQERFRAAVILVHHKPKGGATPRGHGSLTADFETTIEFETFMNKSTGRPVHKATVRKQREGKAGFSWWFSLPVIKVGQNKWGNDETSCAVVPIENTSGKVHGFKMSDNDLLFMRSLFEALTDHPVTPPSKCPVTIRKAVRMDDVRAVMRSYSIDKNEADEKAADNRFRGNFKRAGDRMRDGGIIGVQDGIFWYSGKAFDGMETAGAQE